MAAFRVVCVREANLQTVYFLLMRGWIHLAKRGLAAVAVALFESRPFLGFLWWRANSWRRTRAASAALLAFSPSHVGTRRKPQLHVDHLSRTAVDLLLRAGRGIGAKRLGALDTGQHPRVYSHDFAALVLVAQPARCSSKQACALAP